MYSIRIQLEPSTNVRLSNQSEYYFGTNYTGRVWNGTRNDITAGHPDVKYGRWTQFKAKMNIPAIV